jgi:hypothetical protein
MAKTRTLFHHFLNSIALRKFFLYTGITMLTLLLLALGGAYFMRDKIVSHFIDEANKQLATPVKIGNINVSLLANFPDLSLEFTDVYVEDSHPEEFPLFKAKQVAFSLNAYDAWQGIYNVKGLRVRTSQTNIRINEKGVPNYIVTRDTASASSNIAFNIRNINLSDQHVTYADDYNNQQHEFTSQQLNASITLANHIYSIDAKGDVTSNQVGIQDWVFFRDKAFALNLDMAYNETTTTVQFNPSTIALPNGQYELNGTYVISKKPTVDLLVKGKNTSIQTIFSLLPTALTQAVEKYESEGDLYFTLAVKGALTKPTIVADFGCRNATILHPETNFRLSGTTLSGKFTSVGLSNLSLATIQLKDVSGKLNNKPFSGSFELRNFKNPFVDARFNGELNAESLKPFLTETLLNDASGIVNANVALRGEIEKLKNRKTAQQVDVSGTITLQNVSLSTRFRNIQLKNVSGDFQFTKNDLAMSEVGGTLGHSDFKLNGFFKNIVSYLIFENQPIGIETDLAASYLDLDELLMLAFGDEQSDNYQFALSPNIYLNFDCRIGRLTYQKFKATDLTGNLLVKNQVAKTDRIKFKAMGGSLLFSGVLNSRTQKSINLLAKTDLKSIHVDSLFYVFGNFKQDWLQDRHLKGQTTADIDFEADFTPALRLIPQSLVADMTVSIKKGELNNFEPMQELNRYLDDDGLKAMRFAELKNEIHIEKEVILIPKMEVRTNVTTIQISGRHTFDQHIDYHIVAPLRNKRKINVEEAGDAFQQEGGRIKVYFKITGTTDNYKVAYDTDALKQKIASDLKKEVTELKDAFKDKNVKKKALELEKDDYFEWDNNKDNQ